MEFRNALTILFSNIGYVFKILLWLVISLIITAAIGAAILIPLWNVFLATTDVSVVAGELKEILTSIWNGSVNFRVAVHDLVPSFVGFLKSLGENAGACVGLAFTLVLLYVIYSFLMGLSYYTIGDIINKLMRSNLRFGFASAMALNLKKCSRYSFSRLTISLPIDLVLFVLMAFIAYGLFLGIGIFTLPIMLILVILCCSFKALLFSGWMPRVLYHPEERIYTSFTRSFPFVKSNFGELFKAYGITFTCVYIIAALLVVPTCGLVLLLLPSIYYFLLRAVELIAYYKTKGYSFYVDGVTVVNTVEYGLRSSNQTETNDPALEDNKKDYDALSGENADVFEYGADEDEGEAK